MTMMTQDVCKNLLKIDHLRNDLDTAVGALFALAEGAELNSDMQKGLFFMGASLHRIERELNALIHVALGPKPEDDDDKPKVAA
jgi:nanoRNase/pAp phosphatase (c-di-AMP/oligoRNAs hydrolase)